MAVSLSNFYPTHFKSKTPLAGSSLNVAGKVYEGLRLRLPNSYGVSKRIESGTRNGVPTRGRISMMAVGTPMMPYKNPGENRWQWVDLWNCLYRERIVWIGKYINDEFGNQLLATMLYLDSIEDSSKLFLYIGSRGGDITPSMAIYDTMQSLQSPVATLCMAYTYNVATFILAGGVKGSRFALPLSRIQLQAPGGTAHGKADDIRVEADELTRIKNYLYKELAEKTGQPVEKIHEDLRMPKSFSGPEAVEYGIIDRVVRPKRLEGDEKLSYKLGS